MFVEGRKEEKAAKIGQLKQVPKERGLGTHVEEVWRDGRDQSPGKPTSRRQDLNCAYGMGPV